GPRADDGGELPEPGAADCDAFRSPYAADPGGRPAQVPRAARAADAAVPPQAELRGRDRARVPRARGARPDRAARRRPLRVLTFTAIGRWSRRAAEGLRHGVASAVA